MRQLADNQLDVHGSCSTWTRFRWSCPTSICVAMNLSLLLRSYIHQSLLRRRCWMQGILVLFDTAHSHWCIRTFKMLLSIARSLLWNAYIALQHENWGRRSRMYLDVWWVEKSLSYTFHTFNRGRDNLHVVRKKIFGPQNGWCDIMTSLSLDWVGSK